MPGYRGRHHVPLSVLTGFLGCGKSTLLSPVLSNPQDLSLRRTGE